VTKYSALSRELKWPNTQHDPRNLSDQILRIIQGNCVTKYSALSKELKWPNTQHDPRNLSYQILSILQGTSVIKYSELSRNLSDQILSMIQGNYVTKYSALSRELKWPILSTMQGNQVTKYPTWSRNIIILYLLKKRENLLLIISQLPPFLTKRSGTSTGKEEPVYQAQLVPVGRRKTFSELYLHTASKNLILAAVNWTKRVARLTASWTSGERYTACRQAKNVLSEIVNWIVR
jgi:hypothetical protein